MPFDAMNQTMSAAKSKVWTLDMSLELVRAMEPFIKPMGYTAMITGGVLQQGSSKRDLDIIFMPTEKLAAPKDIELLTWLGEKFGAGTRIKTAVAGKTVYRHYMQFKFDGLFIDTFIA